MVRKFTTYQKAKKFALSNNIKTKEQWAKFIKNNEIPSNIPRRPSHIYRNKGWKGWPKFLNNGNEWIKPRSYEEAKKFVQKLKLTYQKDWVAFCNSGKKPKDIPKNLQQTYKKYWKGWGEFLGSGIVGVTKARDYYPLFEELKDILRQNKIKATPGYIKFVREQRKTGNLYPTTPKRTYPEFTTWEDFFSKEPKIYAKASEIKKYIKDNRITSLKHYRTLFSLKMIPSNFPYHPGFTINRTYQRRYVSYENAKHWAKEQNINSVKKWFKFVKNKKYPNIIPRNPKAYYKKRKEWISWTDFLGKKVKTERKLYYEPFEVARNYARSLGYTKITQWKAHVKAKRFKYLPSTPETAYKEDWKGWSDFLGNEIIANQLKNYRSFRSARTFIRKLGLKSHEEWIKFTKSGKLPKDIPATPRHVYQKEWTNINNFIGYGEKNYWGFKKAHRYAINLKLHGQRDWEKWRSTNKRPKRMPPYPPTIYKKYWKGWRDWLYGKPRYKSFEDAKKFVRSLNLKTIDEWRNYATSGKKPKDIPFWVDITYKDKGWKGFRDFLGTGPPRIVTKFPSYEDAQTLIQKFKIKNGVDYKKLHKQGKIPQTLPRHPENVYGDRKRD